jgi:hypothetical protein
MRKIREVLRLSLAEGLSRRQVSASLGVPRITVRRFVERAKLAGLTWPLPVGMDDQALEQRLFGPPPPPSVTRPLPGWAHVHHELRRMGVTLLIGNHEKVGYDETVIWGWKSSGFI